MSGNVSVSPYNPVQQKGCKALNPPSIYVIANFAPTSKDNGANVGDLWVFLNTTAYMLIGKPRGVANWVPLGGGGSGIITINTIFPDVSANFTLTAGTNITLTPETNGIIISSPSGGITWQDKDTSFAAVPSFGYFCIDALTVTLPAAPPNGTEIIIVAGTSGTVVVQAAVSQSITVANMSSSEDGTASSTASGSILQLVYRINDGEWFSISTAGSWTLT